MSGLSKLSFVFAVISLISMMTIRYLLGDWVPFCWVALGLFVFFVLAGIFISRQLFKEFLTMKTTKHGMNMGVMILLMLALLIILNFIAIRHYATWDFSIGQSNTLSPQSVQLVRSLKEPLKIRFFYKKGVEGNEENRKAAEELIKRYQDQNSQVQLDFIEVNEHPDIALDYGVDKGNGTLFVDYNGHRSRVEKIEEQEFTSALVKVTRTKDKTIYFVVGHGEKELEESHEGSGLNALKRILENSRYAVKTLALSQYPKIPDDADVVAIAGPSQNFQDFELKALSNYLASGGSLFLALKSQNSPDLSKWVGQYGVHPQDDYILNVIDTAMGKGVNPGSTIGAIFSANNEITKSFGHNEVTVFRMPMSLKKDEKPPEGLVIDELVKTSENSMSFKSMKIHTEGPMGSYALVDTVRGRAPDAKKEFILFVAGDVDFMTNQMLYQNLNRDLVMNAVSSLSHEETLIGISAKEPQITQMFLTGTKFIVFLLCFIIPLPLILLSISITLWMKRRNA